MGMCEDRVIPALRASTRKISERYSKAPERGLTTYKRVRNEAVFPRDGELATCLVRAGCNKKRNA